MLTRVLVVEDDPIQRELLVSFLESLGYFVATAGDGREALQVAQIGWFDLVVMDYNLPEADGLAAARLLAALADQGERPAIIALTAAMDELLARTDDESAVFDAFEQKPWNPPALAAKMAALAARPRLRDRIWSHGASLSALATAPGDSGSSLEDKSRVLVVEDDALACSLLKSALEQSGYQVDAAANGIEAVQQICASQYDVAVIDYQLPELGGLASAKLIFDLVRSADRPRLVAFTACADDLRLEDDGSADLFDEVIAKSAGLPEVVQAVHRCAQYKRTRAGAVMTEVTRLASALPSLCALTP